MPADGRRWDVTTEEGFLAYYDATFADAYRCAARLTAGDRSRAEDLVHDAFVTLLRAAQRGDIVDAGPGLVVTRVRHRFVDVLRSRDREDRRLRLVASAPADDDHASTMGTLAMLEELSDRERAALVFRYVDDLPVAEVAELLGTTIRATESLLQRAKRKARGSEGA